MMLYTISSIKYFQYIDHFTKKLPTRGNKPYIKDQKTAQYDYPELVLRLDME